MRSEQFQSYLEEELSWRKKEISELYLLAKTNSDEILLKSLILILYAHWEGYIKKSSKLYMKFIVEEKIKVKDLTQNFKAIALKDAAKKCLETSDSLNLVHEFQLLNKYTEVDDKKFKVTVDPNDDQSSSIIHTDNNLKPKVFKNIINILGLSYHNSFITRENYINSSLLANRNAIGHGSKFDLTRQQNFSLTIQDITKLKEFILLILDFYTDTLLKYQGDKLYLICNVSKKDTINQENETWLENELKKLEEKYEGTS